VRRLVALLAAASSAGGSAHAKPPPARIAATVDTRTARLGQPTELALRLQVRPPHSPVRSISVRYPRGWNLATSGLGADECKRPASDFVAVLLDLPLDGLAGCPRNAIIARGRARAQVRIPGMTLPQTALLTLLAGPLERDQLRLVVLAEGINPFGLLLAFQGQLKPAAAPWAGTITLDIPQIAPSKLPYDGATFALVDVSLILADRRIVYHDPHGVRYHPPGIELPTRCPPHGWRFRADLHYLDGTRSTATTRLPCPRP